MAVRIQLRRDTSTNWSLNNPILRPGEVGIETDTLKFKIGPVVQAPAIGTAWNSITTYANVVPSDLNSTLNGYLQTNDLGVTVAELVDGSLYIPGTDIVFEGLNADAYETILAATEPTADRTITLPDASGTVALTSDITSAVNAISTTDIEEGTNLYFTDERAQDATAAALAAGTHTNITVTYNDSSNSISLTGAQTYSDENAVDAVATALSNGTHTNISIAYNDNDNSISFTAAPGYTNEEAVDAVAAALAAGTHTNISVSYDDNGNSISLTGAVTYTDENAQDAVGNAVGNGLDYDDNTGAISVDPSEFALSAVGAPTADIDLASYKITNLAAPTASGDAANKAYVDNTTAGLNFHAAVHAATTTYLDAAYNNGTSGVGATLTSAVNAALVIDGHTLSVGERVLVKNQGDNAPLTNPAHNGIYTVTATGDGSNPWVLTRATDADNSPVGEMAYGDFTFVQMGTTNGGFGYIVNTTGTITIGTTPISYVQFNAGQVVTAGNGLTEPTAGTLAIDTGVTVDLNTAQTLINKTITGSFTGDLTGNASTVTNGVYTNGTYSNPSWITGLAWSKVSSTPTTVSGYGITDAATLTGTQTLTNKTLSSPTVVVSSSQSISGNATMGYDNGWFVSSNQATAFSVGDQISILAGVYPETPDINGTWTISGKTIVDGYARYTSAGLDTLLDGFPFYFASTWGVFTISGTANVTNNVSSTELAYLDGVTSAIQTQLNSKADLSGATFTGNVNVGSYFSADSTTGSITVGDPIASNYFYVDAQTGTVTSGIWEGTKVDAQRGGTGLSGPGGTGDLLYSPSATTWGTLNIGQVGQVLTVTDQAGPELLPVWADAPISLPEQNLGTDGKYLKSNGQTASWENIPISSGSLTIDSNTATVVDYTALGLMTCVEYTLILQQGSKLRSSKVLIHSDTNTADLTEFAIMEMGGTMSGVSVTAEVTGISVALKVTVTDAASSNVTAKFTKVVTK